MRPGLSEMESQLVEAVEGFPFFHGGAPSLGDLSMALFGHDRAKGVVRRLAVRVPGLVLLTEDGCLKPTPLASCNSARDGLEHAHLPVSRWSAAFVQTWTGG